MIRDPDLRKEIKEEYGGPVEGLKSICMKEPGLVYDESVDD